MLFGRTPYSVLVVSSGEKITEFLNEILESGVYSPVVYAKSGGDRKSVV